MKKPLPMKECYGSYGIDKKCARCTYRASCELYTATGKGIDSRMGLVSFDNTVEEWLAADTAHIPGQEEELPDRRSEMIEALARLFRWIVSLDSYTLGIVTEMVAPENRGKGGVSVAALARARGCSRQAIHEKMVAAVARHPELASLFQTALRRVGHMRSKFRMHAERAAKIQRVNG